MNTVDNVIAFRILKMLITPFSDTDAFRFGIIDKNGKVLKVPANSVEQASYDYLDKLVFNLKRILGKIPGGETKLASLLTAYYLVKECYENEISDESLNEDEEIDILPIEKLQEELSVMKLFLEDMAANATGDAVKTNEPVVNKKKNIDARLFSKLARRKKV